MAEQKHIVETVKVGIIESIRGRARSLTLPLKP